MKQILLVLALIAFTVYGRPQGLKNSITAGSPEVATDATIGNSSNPAAISARAVKNFKKTFKDAPDVKWYEMPDGYRANFTKNGVRCRLDYDKKGNWLHTIKYIDQKNLPVDVRRYVASNYLDYTITKIEEIDSPRNPTTYVIHLEGEKNWINLRVRENEVSELETINKS